MNTETIVQTLIEEFGLNPMNIYCSVTGKPIGTIHADVFLDTIESIGSDDPEIITDDLFARTLLSMRPSPAWNSVTATSIQILTESRPHEVLAYCMIRLFEPNPGLKQSSELRIRRYFQRIQIWQSCEFLRSQNVDINELLYMLVEIDAKYNLTSLPVPDINAITGLAAMAESFDAEIMMEFWKAWYWPLQESYLKRLKQAERQENWIRGNSHARSAHFKMFMDSKPPSKAKVKAAAKKETQDFFLSILAEVVDVDLETKKLVTKPATPSTYVRPSTKAPRRFGSLKTQEA